MNLLYYSILTLFGVFASAQTKCGPGKPCPSDKPCCSLYGECGTGAYCLGACDFKNSFNSSSCAPLPVCESKQHTFENTDSIISQDQYDGDPDKHGWITNGKVIGYKNHALLIMEKESYGTVISSTRAVWYGKVSARMKTSRGPGVVSAFILMSGSKDEIDYEFVGSELENAQTNYYYQGILNHTNSEKVGVSNTHENFHTFEIDWQPDVIHWSIDGTAVRSLKKEDTYNTTTKKYHFPQTPSTIYLSLWPGGSSQNAEGTIQWAGGPINWSMKELDEKPGYLWAAIDNISIKCYNPPKLPDNSDVEKAYIFTSREGTEGHVGYTNEIRYLAAVNKQYNKTDGKTNKFKVEIDETELVENKKDKEKAKTSSFQTNKKSKSSLGSKGVELPNAMAAGSLGFFIIFCFVL